MFMLFVKCKKILLLVTFYVLLALVFCSCTSSKNNNSLIFSVMGDVPRSEEEQTILKEQISKHNKYSSAQFVIHVGDIKSGNPVCDEENYELVAGYLKKFKVPVFIIPGDNEWNDCENPKNAWNNWIKYFNKFEQNWKIPFDISRQENYPVNFTFTKNNVQFIGINLVGGRIHDQMEWDEMQINAAQWIDDQTTRNNVDAVIIFAQASPDEKHVLFTEQFAKSINEFAKPVLFIHGDGHVWLYNESYLVPNMIRVQVDKGGIADPLEVTVKSDSLVNFKFNRNPFNEKDILIENR